MTLNRLRWLSRPCRPSTRRWTRRRPWRPCRTSRKRTWRWAWPRSWVSRPHYTWTLAEPRLPGWECVMGQQCNYVVMTVWSLRTVWNVSDLFLSIGLNFDESVLLCVQSATPWTTSSRSRATRRNLRTLSTRFWMRSASRSQERYDCAALSLLASLPAAAREQEEPLPFTAV